jgi:hypothetical protein
MATQRHLDFHNRQKECAPRRQEAKNAKQTGKSAVCSPNRLNSTFLTFLANFAPWRLGAQDTASDQRRWSLANPREFVREFVHVSLQQLPSERAKKGRPPGSKTQAAFQRLGKRWFTRSVASPNQLPLAPAEDFAWWIAAGGDTNHPNAKTLGCRFRTRGAEASNCERKAQFRHGPTGVMTRTHRAKRSASSSDDDESGGTAD